jgi:hypothetical protein
MKKILQTLYRTCCTHSRIPACGTSHTVICISNSTPHHCNMCRRFLLQEGSEAFSSSISVEYHP